jgi:translation machinery-associated protein 16
VERLLTIIGLLDPEVTHLEDLAAVHAFIKESVLPIAQERLAEEQAARRPGRPPSPDEVMLQDLVAREKEEYRTGMEIPDLTNEINVRLLRQWDGDKQGLALFRLVRISEAEP